MKLNTERIQTHTDCRTDQRLKKAGRIIMTLLSLQSKSPFAFLRTFISL